MDSLTDPPRRIAKVGHRKSRRGCTRCKARRVKCDETHPVCGNCTRLTLDCAWPQAPPTTTISPDSPINLPSNVTNSGNGLPTPPRASPASTQLDPLSTLLRPGTGPDLRIYPSIAPDNQDVVIPESKERRLLEHRLMQNWFQNLAKPFPVSQGADWERLFTSVIPKLALTHDNLLYALLTASASHLLLTEPDGSVDKASLFRARQSYLVLAMREQRAMVARLSSAETETEVADAVCVASLLLCINSFSTMRERTLEPYVPPLDYLRMGRGAGTVIWMSIEAVLRSGNIERSSIYVIARSYPRFGQDQSYFSPSMRRDFDWVLTGGPQGVEEEVALDDAGREAYEKTLSYVGSIHHAIRTGEPTYAVCRRIQGFPLLMPALFIQFLEERRPRALVVLAHFFAVVTGLDERAVWWLGAREGQESTAKREIRAISEVLPAEWMPLMVWPLDVAGLR